MPSSINVLGYVLAIFLDIQHSLFPHLVLSFYAHLVVYLYYFILLLLRLQECLLASPDLWSLLSKVLKYCLLFADNLQRFHKSIEMSSEELEAALHITLKRKQAVLERQIAANGGDASTTSSLSLPSSTNASSNASPQVLGSTLRRTSMASQESKTGVTLTESEIRRVRMKLHSAKVAEGVLQRNYQSMVKDFSDRFDEKLRVWLIISVYFS